jgi:signal transduction histidine kinase
VSVSVTRNQSMDPSGASGIYPALPAASPTGGDLQRREAENSGASVGLTGDFACLTVVDVGSGMTPDFIKERLFKPFDTTKGSKGMGIGAYQVREYIRSVGGRVKVQSAPGDGTRFTLWLPLRSPPEEPPQP